MASASAGNRLTPGAPSKPIQCPHCHQSETNLVDGHRTVCRRCSKSLRRVFQFCWACRREWPRTGSLAQTATCTLPKCAVHAALLSEDKITDINSAAFQCPYFRACPNCKALLTHTGVGCRYVTCPECDSEFCFRCLQEECVLSDEEEDDYYIYEEDEDEDEESPLETCAIVGNDEVLQNL